MYISLHWLERFQERAFIDFLDNNPIYRNKQILNDIKANFNKIMSNSFWSFMIEWKYCKYILKNNTIITVYKKKTYMFDKERKEMNKLKHNIWLDYIRINKNLIPNIKKLFDLTKLELK